MTEIWLDKRNLMSFKVERRRYPRFHVDLPIRIYGIDSFTRHYGRVINASEAGLLVYSPEKMEVGQRLKSRLSFMSDSASNAIEVLIEVVWMGLHLNEAWGDYESGVKFLDISPEDKTKLTNFLITIAQEPSGLPGGC